MEIRKPEPSLIRAGFVLFTLALLTGFAIPAFLNHKMALAAHITGILNALILMALGLVWGLGHGLSCGRLGNDSPHASVKRCVRRRTVEGGGDTGTSGVVHACDSRRGFVSGLRAPLKAGSHVTCGRCLQRHWTTACLLGAA
jgi:hypothetical protein